MSTRQRWLLLLTVLYVLMMSSALLLIYSKHQSRRLFVDLQQLKQQVDALNTEWSQLQLEQGAWSGHARIESKARKELSMIVPRDDDIVYMRLQ